MYSISVAIVASWIHILIKLRFPVRLVSHARIHGGEMLQLWTREIGDRFLLNCFLYWKRHGQRKRTTHPLISFQPLQEAEIKMEHKSRWFEDDVKLFFFFFFACFGWIHFNISFKTRHFYEEIMHRAAVICLHPCPLPQRKWSGKVWYILLY